MPGLLSYLVYLPGYPRQSALISRRGSGLAGGAEQRKPFSVHELPNHTISLSHVASLQLKDNLSGVAASKDLKRFSPVGGESGGRNVIWV